jgi:hypothetical protein
VYLKCSQNTPKKHPSVDKEVYKMTRVAVRVIAESLLIRGQPRLKRIANLGQTGPNDNLVLGDEPCSAAFM